MRTHKIVEAWPNQKNKTFTLRKKTINTDTGKVVETVKYRTFKMADDEFRGWELSPSSDWKYFLRTTQDYITL